MFEQHLFFGMASITAGIMLVYTLQREAFEQRCFPEKRPVSHTGTLLLWSTFTALVYYDYCNDYFDFSADVLGNASLIIALTIGFFLIIANMGFLIAMWRTRAGQPYLSISGVLPRILFMMIGLLILDSSFLYALVFFIPS